MTRVRAKRRQGREEENGEKKSVSERRLQSNGGGGEKADCVSVESAAYSREGRGEKKRRRQRRPKGFYSFPETRRRGISLSSRCEFVASAQQHQRQFAARTRSLTSMLSMWDRDESLSRSLLLLLQPLLHQTGCNSLSFSSLFLCNLNETAVSFSLP